MRWPRSSFLVFSRSFPNGVASVPRQRTKNAERSPVTGRAGAVAVLVAVVGLAGDMPDRLRAQAPDPCAVPSASLKHTGTDRPDRGAPRPGSKATDRDHDDRGRHLDSIWAHRAALAHHKVLATHAAARSEDVGEVAVLHDAGDLVIAPNPFDLRGTGIEFSPTPDGGFTSSPRAHGFRSAAGEQLPLADDDAIEVQLPFEYTFYGQRYTNAFVSSDGNITFGRPDGVTGSRTVSRLLSGPPRVAVFLADLDPSSGGRVVAGGDPSAFSVTWCGVNGFGSADKATVQATLRPDGSIEMQFGPGTTLDDTVVGVSPGETTDFSPVDFTAPQSSGTGSQGMGERFATDKELDIVAVGRRFLSAHPDEFDSLVVFTDTPLLHTGFAVEYSVANAVHGLNTPVFDSSREHGSTTGRLQSIEVMDFLGKWPDDPFRVFRGENSTLSILGQEVGHRWLAFITFRDHLGQRSDALLGRDRAHWSFFFDSDASVVEGNDIEDLGNGSFRTVAAVQRYSLLDQYVMGLVGPADVPPFFYVENPTNVTPERDRDSPPRRGVTFRGTRRDVTIDDVIAELGPRTPPAAESPRVWKQAFLYVVTGGRGVEPSDVEKIDRIRVGWEQFFSRATDSRMRSVTSLGTAR